MSPLAIIETSVENSSYTQFMQEWMQEIEDIFPHFNLEDAERASIYLLEYGGINAGVFIYLKKGDELHVEVDYLIPEFRDLGVGELFFKRKIDEFKDKGYKRIVALTDNTKHRTYLMDIGFELSASHPDRYEMVLND